MAIAFVHQYLKEGETPGERSLDPAVGLAGRADPE